MPAPERAQPHRRRAVAVVLAVVGTLAVGATVAAQEDEVDREAAGRELFGAHCSTCHGAQGRGTDRAPAIQDASPALVDFVIRTGRMPLPELDAPVRRRPPVLDEEQRRAVVAYWRTVNPAGPDVPGPDPAAGDLSAGRELYETNCIACHSAFGQGIAVSQNDLAPGLEQASPVEVAEAIRTGPGVMPVFGPDVIDEEEVDSLIRYVNYLRERPQPGGITFGRSGPVTEGLVSWGIGIVLLLVAAYLIGERRAG